MIRRPPPSIITVFACLSLLMLAGCGIEPPDQPHKPRMTLFVGIDASGSFKNSGDYTHALNFLAHYIYGHLNELGGLEKPYVMFVASVGGANLNEPKSFHPIHDFLGKEVAQIEADLQRWFPPRDIVTDFNPFFREVARITKDRNLVLSPVSIMLVTDGIPDSSVSGLKAGKPELYQTIQLKPLEYLARNVTLRLAYVSPKVGDQWRKHVPRDRVRLWTIDSEVMKGWKNQMQPGLELRHQDRFWKWVQDNVDFRIRSTHT